MKWGNAKQIAFSSRSYFEDEEGNEGSNKERKKEREK